MIEMSFTLINQFRVNIIEQVGVTWLDEWGHLIGHWQSSSMAFDEVNEDAVYTCVGHPLRSDIRNIVHWMLNDNFQTAYKRTTDVYLYFLYHICTLPEYVFHAWLAMMQCLT